MDRGGQPAAGQCKLFWTATLLNQIESIQSCPDLMYGHRLWGTPATLNMTDECIHAITFRGHVSDSAPQEMPTTDDIIVYLTH